MYADQRYMPRSPRSVSLGAALAVNGLVLAGLLTFVPNFVPRQPPGSIDTYSVNDRPPPPPEKVEKKIEPEIKPQQDEIYIRDPIVVQPDQPLWDPANERLKA